MGIELALRYFFILILPAIYLYILAAFIYARSSHLKVARLIAIFLFLGAFAYTFDFMRVLLPVEYNHFIQMYIVLLAVNLAFAIIIHMIYFLVQPIANLKVPLMPYVLYIFPTITLCISLLETFVYGYPEYINENGWVYRSKAGLTRWNLIAAFCMYGISLYLLIKGYKHSKTKDFKLYFKINTIFAVIAVTLLACWNLDIISFRYLLPPTYSLIMVIFIGTLSAVVLNKLDILPSLVKRYEIMIGSSPTATIYINSKGEILESNVVALRDFKLQKGKRLHNYLGFNENKNQLAVILNNLEKQMFLKSYEISFTESSGRVRHILMDGTCVKLGEGTYFYIMLHDVTHETQNKKISEYYAYHDSLTGIYNRHYFEREVKTIMQNEYKGMLVLCDLNYFKSINDTYGHQIGDEVLIFTANLFQQVLPKPNIFARLGGDEFIMYFHSIENAVAFKQAFEYVRDSFKELHFKKDEISIEVIPSFGFAANPSDSTDYESLYRIADLHMYEDKRNIKEQQKNVLNESEEVVLASEEAAKEIDIELGQELEAN